MAGVGPESGEVGRTVQAGHEIGVTTQRWLVEVYLGPSGMLSC